MHRLISLPPLVKISRLLHWLKGPRRTPPVCRVPALEKAELAASDREAGFTARNQSLRLEAVVCHFVNIRFRCSAGKASRRLVNTAFVQPNPASFVW